MFRLVKNNIRRQPGAQDRLVAKMTKGLLQLQRYVAGKLNDKTAQCKPGRVKAVLALLCLLFGTINTFILFSSSGNHVRLAPVKQIAIPANIGKPSFTGTDGHIANPGSQRILRFKNYLDSLRMTEGGRKIYDSLYALRPGLLDSLQQFKYDYSFDLYNNNKKQ